MTIKSAILPAITVIALGIAATASLSHAQDRDAVRLQRIPDRQCYGPVNYQGRSGELGFSCIFAYGDGTKCVWAIVPARSPGASPSVALQCEFSDKPLAEPLPER